MVENLVDMDAVFQALAHEARRSMLRRLAAESLTVGQLAEPLTMSLAAAAKHVEILVRAGLIRKTVRGRTRFCQLQPQRLLPAAEWLNFYESYWNKSLDSLEGLFTAETNANKESE